MKNQLQNAVFLLNKKNTSKQVIMQFFLVSQSYRSVEPIYKKEEILD